ncbi:hypothetical protein [Tardiphaga robiniae]|uniref:Uncharacterized protein n=1 Tax=Tardiphaga robiniae TaxID=943830 RepID=A0A7G6TUJ1_9BRAD|nr:hypothetical protein [Tardiphaga robiniae]QND70423.1 hypothetical protein HB776_03560 [Tardiphaga robiniae]
MDKLIIAALACLPNHRMVDIADKLPPHIPYVDIVVSVEPFYARFYIYPVGLPEDSQQCCGNKASSVLRLTVGNGKFCIRQSQPNMKWQVRGLATPGISL